MRRIYLTVSSITLVVSIASAVALLASNVLNRQAESGIYPDYVLPQVTDQLKTASRLMPLNPDPLDNLGIVHLLADGEGSTEQALSYYRELVSVRPNQGLGWAKIVHTKTRLNQIDDEWRVAFEHASEMGGREPDVYNLLTAAAIDKWLVLSQDDRIRALEVMADAVLNISGTHKSEYGRRIRDRGFKPLVCQTLQEQRREAAFCR